MKLRDLLDKEKCPKSPTGQHVYEIIKDSGYRTGTPLWKCKHCNQTIKSS